MTSLTNKTDKGLPPISDTESGSDHAAAVSFLCADSYCKLSRRLSLSNFAHVADVEAGIAQFRLELNDVLILDL